MFEALSAAFDTTREAREERENEINACRHPNVRSLLNVHLANLNSFSYSYYMMYIVAEKSGANAEGSIFQSS